MNQDEYAAALIELDRILDVEAPDAEQVDALTSALMQYEAAHFPIEPPSLVESLSFRLGETVKLLARERAICARVCARLAYFSDSDEGWTAESVRAYYEPKPAPTAAPVTERKP